MGYQSGINAMLGTVAGATFGIQKTLQDRQKEALKKVEQQQEAKKEQQQRLRKSIILDKHGQNIMVPIKPESTEKATKPEPKKSSILLGSDGRNLTYGTTSKE